jgi:hypothetical protein
MLSAAFVISALLLSYPTAIEPINAGLPPSDLEGGLPGEHLQAPIHMTCTAQQYCPPPFDGPIMCTGNSSCQVFTYEISCDGQIIGCPCSIAPSGCGDPVQFCVCRKDGESAPRCAMQFC